MLLKAVVAAAIVTRSGNFGQAASFVTGTARKGEAGVAAAISGPEAIRSGSGATRTSRFTCFPKLERVGLKF